MANDELQKREQAYMLAMMAARRDLSKLYDYLIQLSTGNQAAAEKVFPPTDGPKTAGVSPQVDCSLQIIKNLLIIESAQSGQPVTREPTLGVCDSFFPENAPILADQTAVHSGNASDSDEDEDDDETGEF